VGGRGGSSQRSASICRKGGVRPVIECSSWNKERERRWRAWGPAGGRSRKTSYRIKERVHQRDLTEEKEGWREKKYDLS